MLIDSHILLDAQAVLTSAVSGETSSCHETIFSTEKCHTFENAEIGFFKINLTSRCVFKFSGDWEIYNPSNIKGLIKGQLISVAKIIKELIFCS